MRPADAPRPILLGLALFTALACGAGANAANYDPRIAWTSFEGKGDTIYLANADGTLKVPVYKTNKTTITGLDLGAGRVAFTEGGVLKVFSYTVTTNGITATAPVVLDDTGAPYQGALAPDFSPDGTQLLYLRWVQSPDGSAGSREIRVVPSDGAGVPKVLVTAAQLTDTRHIGTPRWLSGSEFAFSRQGGTPWWMSVMLVSLDTAFEPTAPPLELFTSNDPGFTSLGLASWEDFDISHTGPSILISANPPTGSLRTFVQYDYVADTFSRRFTDSGWRGHNQAGDASVVYVHLPLGSYYGNGVYRWVAATNRATAISGKGAQTIRFVDARP